MWIKQIVTIGILSLLSLISNAQHYCNEAIRFQEIDLPVNTGEAQYGPDYGCISSTHNPSWFYIEIAISGNLDLELSGSEDNDVDFVFWGPFNEPTCNYNDLSENNIVDCSYSGGLIEQVNIPNVQAGEFYMVLITNYNGNFGRLLIQSNGSAIISNCNNITDFGIQTITQPDCENAYSNGSLMVHFANEYPPYQIHWNTNDTTQTISDLSSGMYTVTVTDQRDSSCASTVKLNNVNNPIRNQVILEPKYEYCLENMGEISVRIVDGQNNDVTEQGYEIIYDGGVASNQFSMNNLSEGVHSVEIMHQDSCLSQTFYYWLEPKYNQVYVRREYKCYDCVDPSGYIKVFLDTNSLDYDRAYFFNWMDHTLPDTTYLSNCYPGTYQFVVYDTLSCYRDTFQIEFKPSFRTSNFYNINGSIAECRQPTGYVNINLNTNSSYPDEYRRVLQMDWFDSNLSDNLFINNLDIGVYNGVLKDTNGCFVDTISYSLFPSDYNMNYNFFDTHTSRCDYASGTWNVSYNPTVNHEVIDSIFWSNGDTTYNNTNHFLLPGEYTIKIIGKNNCEYYDTLTIFSEAYDVYLGSYPSINPSPCYLNQGSINAHFYSSLSSPVYLKWNNQNNSIQFTSSYDIYQNSLPYGYIPYTITTSSGCVRKDSVLMLAKDVNVTQYINVEDGINCVDIDLINSSLSNYYRDFKWSTLTGGSFTDSVNISTYYNYSKPEVLNDTSIIVLESANQCNQNRHDTILFSAFLHSCLLKIDVFENDSMCSYETIQLTDFEYVQSVIPLHYSNSRQGLFRMINDHKILTCPIVADNKLPNTISYYSGAHLLWTQADTITLYRDSTVTSNLKLTDYTATNSLYEATTNVSGTIHALDEFGKARVILTNERCNYMTYSDYNGNYTFGTIVPGKYKLWIDRPGYYMQSQAWEIDVSMGFDIDSLNFKVQNDTIYTLFQNKTQNFSIWPNPAKKSIIISDSNGIVSYEIFNSLGSRVILNDNLCGSNCMMTELNIENWTKGAYLAKITNSNGQTEVVKFIKE